MTEALIPTENQNEIWQHNNAIKNSDTTTIVNRLSTASWSNDNHQTAVIKQNSSTEGCSKLKSPETRQVQEGLVSTLEHMQVPKWDRTRCPEE